VELTDNSETETLMFKEASEAPAVVARQIAANRERLGAIGERFRSQKPRALVTLARGSSDHAATYARYLIERHLGVLTGSLSPSIASVYGSTPKFDNAVLLAISQSGQSPDLLSAAEQARANGAFVIAMVNDEASQLAALADAMIPLGAGRERSVAATKSFIATLSATLGLLAAWTEDLAIGAALNDLPQKLQQAWTLDWGAAVPLLVNASSMYVVGRGHGFGVAQEAALKLKETCAMAAEAFSAAEVRHGPMALVKPGFPILFLGQQDESLQGVAELAEEFAGMGATVVSAGVSSAPGTRLPTTPADPLIEPILRIASFYRLANALALARGRNPDRPPHLAKVTETV